MPRNVFNRNERNLDITIIETIMIFIEEDTIEELINVGDATIDPEIGHPTSAELL